MSNETKARTAVGAAIDRLNELLPEGQSVPKDPDTILLGPQGWLDSMAYVNFLVALDAEIEDQLGIKTSMADELGEGQDKILTVRDVHSVVLRLSDGGPSGS